MIPRYEYQTMNASHYPSLTEAANTCAREGWRVVSVIGSRGPGYADTLLLEKEIYPEVLVVQQSSTIKFPDETKHRWRWWNPKSW